MGKKRVGNFRSKIFGGFNRRDVIGYIEQLHKKLGDLQEENELLRSKLPPMQPEDNDGINIQIEPPKSDSGAGGSVADDLKKNNSEPPAHRKARKSIDVSVSSNTADSSGQPVSASKTNVKVRKKTKR